MSRSRIAAIGPSTDAPGPTDLGVRATEQLRRALTRLREITDPYR